MAAHKNNSAVSRARVISSNFNKKKIEKTKVCQQVESHGHRGRRRLAKLNNTYVQCESETSDWCSEKCAHTVKANAPLVCQRHGNLLVLLMTEHAYTT